MITLILLHPLQSTPVQYWTFEDESVIGIGRSTDNQVVLYSAVVSRRHVELRRAGKNWEIVNLGANGTYLDGERITQVPVIDGVIIRLARSGPQLQIRLGVAAVKEGIKITSQKKTPAPVVNQPSRDTFVGSPKDTEIEEETTIPDTRAFPGDKEKRENTSGMHVAPLWV